MRCGVVLATHCSLRDVRTGWHTDDCFHITAAAREAKTASVHIAPSQLPQAPQEPLAIALVASIRRPSLLAQSPLLVCTERCVAASCVDASCEAASSHTAPRFFPLPLAPADFQIFNVCHVKNPLPWCGSCLMQREVLMYLINGAQATVSAGRV